MRYAAAVTRTPSPISITMCAILAACSSKSSPPPAATTGDAGTTIDATIAAIPLDAAVDARPGPALAAITVDEVKAVVPVPAEARVIKPHTKDAGRERVEVTFCFERGRVGEVAGRVEEKLRANGWEVSVLVPSDVRVDLSGRHGDLRLAAMLRRGPWAACDGEQGQTYAVLAVHRRAP